LGATVAAAVGDAGLGAIGDTPAAAASATGAACARVPSTTSLNAAAASLAPGSFDAGAAGFGLAAPSVRGAVGSLTGGGCAASTAGAPVAAPGASPADAAVGDEPAGTAPWRGPGATRIAHHTSATSTSTMAPISAARGGNDMRRGAELPGSVVVRRRSGCGASLADEAA